MQWVVRAPIVEDGHDPSVRECLHTVGLDVTVLGAVGHHDDQLDRVGLNRMFPPIERATVEHRRLCPIPRVGHASNDDIQDPPRGNRTG